MIDNPYLDTIISLVLVHASLSILVSLSVERLNKGLGTGGIFLKLAIEQLVKRWFRHGVLGASWTTSSTYSCSVQWKVDITHRNYPQVLSKRWGHLRNSPMNRTFHTTNLSWNLEQ